MITEKILYYYFRIKITILHSIWQWADRKSNLTEERMLQLAKLYDW